MKARRRKSRGLFGASFMDVMNGQVPEAHPAREAISPQHVEIMPIPKEPEMGLVFKEPQSFSCETEGEGFRDRRMFTVVCDGKGWKAMAAWQAEGSGPPPLIMELFNPFAKHNGFLGLANSLMNLILCPSDPIRQTTSFEPIRQLITHRIGHTAEVQK